jgi:hypothetical protein
MLLPLPTPFAAGLGQRVENARSRLLWDADFRAMPRQQLPTTQLGWQSLIAGGYGGAAAAPELASAWRFDGAGQVTDAIGGKDLTNVGGVLQQRSVVGLHRGAAGQRWHKAAEWRDAETKHFAAASSADFNPGAASWALVVVLRHGAMPAAAGTLIDKQVSTGAGWRLERTSAGQYRFIVHDGVNTAVLAIASQRDSAPHYLFLRINRTAGQLQAFTDLGSGTPVALGAVGSIASSVTMKVGGPSGGHVVNSTVPWQCAWMGVLTGAHAENVTSTHMGRFWQHAATPAVVTVYNRNGRVLTEIEQDPAAGVRLAGWKAAQFAWERDAHFEGEGLGAAAHGAIANLLTDSSVAAWVATDVDVTANASEAPNGLLEAEQLVALDDVNHMRTTAAFTAGEKVQFSVYAGGAGTSDDARLVLSIYDATFTTLKIAVTVELTSAWTRATLGGGWTADATATFGFQVALERVDMQTNTWGAQARAGEYDGPLAWSDGAPHTCPAVDARVTGAAAAVLRAAEGELVAEYSCAAATSAGDRFVVDASNAASNVNRRLVMVAAADVVGSIHSSAGALLATMTVAGADQDLLQHERKRVELAWAADRAIAAANRARLRVVNEAETSAVGGAFAYSDTVTTAWLGQDQANANQLGGVLRRVRCYGAATS